MYEQLSVAIRYARKSNAAIILSGDFNTVLNHGLRGQKLDEFFAEHNLNITNDIPDGANTLSFRSSLGHKRRLDLIAISSNIIASPSSASNELHLNSDHRAVHAELQMSISKCAKRNAKNKRGWHPDTSMDDFQRDLNANLCADNNPDLPALEQILKTTADAHDQKPDVAENKIWNDADLQSLLHQRRISSTPNERRLLSHQIRKLVR